MTTHKHEKPVPTAHDIQDFHQSAAGKYLHGLQSFLDKFGTEYIDAADKFGWTALMRAAMVTNNTQILEFLLQNGASLDKKTVAGNTALLLAMTNPNPDNAIVLRKWASVQEQQRRAAQKEKEIQDKKDAENAKSESRIQKLKKTRSTKPSIIKPK